MPKKLKAIPTWRGHYAGFASRLLAVIIDILILAVVIAISNLLYSAVFVNLSAFSQLIFGQSTQTSPEVKIAISVILVFMVFATYFIFFWTVIGSTIGGVIVGLRIVNRQGKNPTPWQSIIRFLAEFLFPLFGAIGSIWILFSQRRRALFDRLAGTFVLYNWDAKPDERFLKKTTDQITGQTGEDRFE